MKILLLADPNSVHTLKWAISLADRGVNLFIFGLGDLKVRNYDSIENINVLTLNQKVTNREGYAGKIKYLKAVPVVKEIISDFKPDIIHAHFATSYGLLGALSNFSPLIISVWGSDVFSFPNKSFLHRLVLKYNLGKAGTILSTSEVMARETKKYTDKIIKVTPFGINLDEFNKKCNIKNDELIIGTLKSLDKRYGIDTLLKAFNILVKKFTDLPLRLMIVGGGPEEDFLKSLASELRVSDYVYFIGRIPYEQIVEYHNQMAVTVFVSNSESFGVAVIEASSCEKPVVVSDVGGLPEVVEDGVTGFIVPPRNPEATAAAIEKLILDESLRDKMGKAGRERVKRLYDWNNNVENMINIYEDVIRMKQD